MKQSKRKQKSRKGRKYEKPLSLYGMTFNEAVGRLVTAKPEPKPAKKPQR